MAFTTQRVKQCVLKLILDLQPVVEQCIGNYNYAGSSYKRQTRRRPVPYKYRCRYNLETGWLAK